MHPLPAVPGGRLAAPLRGRLVDVAVVVAGAGVLLAAAVAGLSGPPADLPWSGLAGLLLGVPVTAFLASRGLALSRPGGAVHVALDSAVLVFLAWTVPAPIALVTWLAGVMLGELLTPERLWSSRAFNLALAALAGGTLLTVLDLLRDLHSFGPADVLALAAGTVGYLTVDLLLTAVSVGSGDRGPVRSVLTDESTPVVSVAVLAVNGVGLLAALLTALVPWAVVLLVPVLLAPVYAARATAAANIDRLRTTVLFDAAAQTQAARDRAQLADGITAAASRLTGGATARLSAGPPGDGDVAARVGVDDRHGLWLAVERRRVGPRHTGQDQAALQVLAALAAQALDRLELLAAMSQAASSDALTGLANRREVERALEQAVTDARAGGAARPGLLYLDLDGFKAVNDAHGHAVGDELLVAVSRRLAASVREADVVGRWGGDEFVVLLRDTDDEHARRTAERLRAAVAGAVSLAGTSGVVLQVSASVGVALLEPGGSPQGLLAAADAAMYAVKQRR